jgi:hypothetical protein
VPALPLLLVAARLTAESVALATEDADSVSDAAMDEGRGADEDLGEHEEPQDMPTGPTATIATVDGYAFAPALHLNLLQNDSVPFISGHTATACWVLLQQEPHQHYTVVHPLLVLNQSIASSSLYGPRCRPPEKECQAFQVCQVLLSISLTQHLLPGQKAASQPHGHLVNRCRVHACVS